MQYHVIETIYTLILYKLCTQLNYTIRKKDQVTPDIHSCQFLKNQPSLNQLENTVGGQNLKLFFFLTLIFRPFFKTVKKKEKKKKKVVLCWQK